MSQITFKEYMALQVKAILESGIGAKDWAEKNAAKFRKEIESRFVIQR
jgi:hypothetical protein